MNDFRLGSPFQDHMVLQRDRPVPIWGWGAPGAEIAVELVRTQARARAGVDGRWMVILAPQPAAGPVSLRVSAGQDRIQLQDVWIGEVWLASGQSNMEMRLEACNDAEEEIAAARDDGIRVWTAEHAIALRPREEIAGRWEVCSPVTAGKFTAVGYYFARALREKLGVAVGILHSSWGGTVAEAWTSREGLLGHPLLDGYVHRLDRLLGPEGRIEKDAFDQARREWEASIPSDPGNRGVEQGWHQPDTPDDAWDVMTLPTGWQTAGHDISGVFWFRREVTLPEGWSGRELELHLGACDKEDHTYFDGHSVGGIGLNDDPASWSRLRIYRISPERVREGRHVVAVRVFSNIYQGGMIGPSAEMWLAPVDAPASERLLLHGSWRYRIERDFGRVSNVPPPMIYGPDNPHTPSALFNGMLAPLIPSAIRGFLWYQGESNATRAGEYRAMFPNLIRDWRRRFGQGELPFYFVQLANYKTRHSTPVDTDWALLREAQRLTELEVPNTGMAVAIDIGDAGDIHPKNKKEVGRRLAALALARTYGLPGAPVADPRPLRARCREREVTIQFTGTGVGLATRDGRPPTGFALAGDDRIFHWAQAEIVGADRLKLTASNVARPLWVRHAWDDDPAHNLTGAAGEPVPPFELALPCGNWVHPDL